MSLSSGREVERRRLIWPRRWVSWLDVQNRFRTFSKAVTASNQLLFRALPIFAAKLLWLQRFLILRGVAGSTQSDAATPPWAAGSQDIIIRLLETRQSALSALFFRIFSSFSFVFALLSKAIETDKPLSVLMHRLGGIVTSEDTLTSNELLLETSSFNVYKRKKKFQSKQKQNNSYKKRTSQTECGSFALRVRCLYACMPDSTVRLASRCTVIGSGFRGFCVR